MFRSRVLIRCDEPEVVVPVVTVSDRLVKILPRDLADYSDENV